MSITPEDLRDVVQRLRPRTTVVAVFDGGGPLVGVIGEAKLVEAYGEGLWVQASRDGDWIRVPLDPKKLEYIAILDGEAESAQQIARQLGDEAFPGTIQR